MIPFPYSFVIAFPLRKQVQTIQWNQQCGSTPKCFNSVKIKRRTCLSIHMCCCIMTLHNVLHHNLWAAAAGMHSTSTFLFLPCIQSAQVSPLILMRCRNLIEENKRDKLSILRRERERGDGEMHRKAVGGGWMYSTLFRENSRQQSAGRGSITYPV